MEMDFKIGMYVRCNIDEDYEDGRDFLIGQIFKINQDTSELYIRFHDIYEKNVFFDHVPDNDKYYMEVQHCKINIGSGLYKDIAAEVLILWTR